ncbi:Nudix hydrolase 20, chloroplastic [Sesamum angolense]|uniref:Nudix hydrolase 20, chloroplastic n=1 Tax=Sesamum angolense TaxID=2727404 RepID=A0AAE1WE80_9LAMI|nr:Nudix hydrolase 20, chloroplastic [Sesamum angolense]
MVGSLSMGSNCCYKLSSSPLFPSSFSSSSIPRRVIKFSVCPPPRSVLSASDHILSSEFSWSDVFNFQTQQPVRSDLTGFFEKVKLCNRNCEKQSEFQPFVIEGHVVGYVHDGLPVSPEFPWSSLQFYKAESDVRFGGQANPAVMVQLRFANHLRRYQDVFTFPKNTSRGSHFGCHIELHPKLTTSEDRTKAVGDVVACLGEELIPGIRNELYPVTSSFGAPSFFSLERAAAPYFGIKAYGVHMNGYVQRGNQKYLWIGKRSKAKPTYPGKLDHLVAGGLPHGIPCGENLVKECEEEAGIPRSITSQAKAVGAVSYLDIDGYRFKRDVLFCYDLELPVDFVPKNEVPFFKENCNLVIIDFLFRHGYIKPEELGYLKLLQSLRSGDCT